MSKCGIITLNGYFNYGNRLQNYALQHTLMKYFDEVETVWYTPKEYVPMQFQWNCKMLIKYILNRNGFRDYCQKEEYIGDTLRCARLKLFTDKYINTRYVYHIPSEKMAREYDFFVVGSDQIWNSMFVDGKAEFLTFVPKEKRVAYAPSIVKTDIKGNTYRNYQKWLGKMQAISVREEADAEFVERATGKRPPVLIDPSMLMEGEKWRNLYQVADTVSLPSKYIFVFLLGQKTHVMAKEIAWIADLYRLQVVDLNDRNNLELYGASPELWLKLIDNASLVYTDSFHGAAFSLLLETPFITRSRYNLNGIDTRILTLTKKMGLDKRMLSSEWNADELGKDLMEVDFTMAKEMLSRERMRSLAYLSKAFGEGGLVDADRDIE